MPEQFNIDSKLTRLAGGMEYILWLNLIGKSRTTGWKWRKPGPNGEPPRVVCSNGRESGKCFRSIRPETSERYFSLPALENLFLKSRKGSFRTFVAGAVLSGLLSRGCQCVVVLARGGDGVKRDCRA